MLGRTLVRGVGGPCQERLTGTDERAGVPICADPRCSAVAAVASSGPSAVAEGIETEELHVEPPGSARVWKETGGKNKGRPIDHGVELW